MSKYIEVDMDMANGSTDDAIVKMDEVYRDSAKTRAFLQEKLMAGIEKMDIDPNGNPKVLEAQMKMISQLEVIIGNRENAATTRTQMRLKKSESDDQTKYYAALTSSILKQLDNSTIPYVHSKEAVISHEAMTRIDEQLSQMEKLDFDNGEVKTDSKDLT